MRVPELFGAMVELASSLGVKGINKLPACWEHQIDEQWWIAVNGHGEPQKCSKGYEVPRFSMCVEFNGWPAGVIDPAGGFIAAGTLANEETLLAAMREATAKAGAGGQA